MSDRESHVGQSHRFETGASFPVPLTRIGQRQSQQAEPLAAHGREQRLLVGEMPVEGCPRHAEAVADGAQGQPLHPVAVDGPECLLQQRPPQVTVVVMPGKDGYVLDSLQGNRDVTGNQLDNQRNSGFPHPFLDYKEHGISVKLEGKEKVGSGEAYVLVFEPAQGSTIKHFIDAQSMLPVKFVMTVNVPQVGADVEQTTTFEDYREVDGVKMPFKLNAASSLQSFTVTLDKVMHNVAVDEKLFAKP